MGATDLPLDVVQTDETGETVVVSNAEFLHALFSDLSGDAAPVVTSFAGNPVKVSAGAWQSRRWRDGEHALSADANNYFSLASFRPDEAGVHRRRKTQFAALHAVMLDDVGGKVPIERLTLRPTWLLETSPGNHQAGYLLAEPLTDGFRADRLMNAVVAAGLCDPGANGPRARLARLPVGMNGKHTPPFVCRMASWAPDLRYSVPDLVDGLQLETMSAERAKRAALRGQSTRPDDGDPVWIPRPDENAVLAALHERGLYKAPLGDGRHDITCPWVQEHTGAVDGGTVYFEPDDNWPLGGFNCRIQDLDNHN